MRRFLTFLSALLIATTSFASSPQDSTSSRGDTQTYIETFEVRIHNLDVIVTDRNGNSVTGLTRDDFVLLEDGVPREISNFAAYDVSAGVARTADAVTRANAAAVAPPPRRVVFFLDQLSLHPSSRGKIIANAMRLVEQLDADDQVLVVSASGAQNVVQSWTSDRAAIRAALDRVMHGALTTADTEAAAEIRFLETQMRLSSSAAEVRDVRRRYAQMVRRRVQQRLGTLRALVASLSAVEGKKVLITVSSSLEAKPGLDLAGDEQEQLQESFSNALTLNGAPGEFIESDASPSSILPTLYDLRPMIADLGRTAAASGVTIYPLQPDVPLELVTPGTVENRRNVRTNGVRNSWSRVLANNEMTMVSLAETTGGRWFRGDGRIDDVFRQIASDVRTYYSLAYHVQGEKNRPRRIDVRVKNRPDLNVRTRSEAQEKSLDREMNDLTMAAILYRHPVNELSIRTTAGTPLSRRDLIAIPVEVQIPMKNLTFLPAANDRYVARFRVHYAAAGAQRDFVAEGQREQVVDISAEELREIVGKTFRYSSDIVVSRGTYRIAVGVMDAVSKLSGFDSVTVETR